MNRLGPTTIRILSICLVSGGMFGVARRAEAEHLVRALPPSVVAVDSPVFLLPQEELLLNAPGQLSLPPTSGRGCLVPWTWQFAPDGLIYKSYLAGGREPRFASLWAGSDNGNSFWDITLGGRVGIIRYGTQDAFWPEGWQLDIEGAAFPRLTLDPERNLVSTDFRFGVPLTFRSGPWETKFAYYHLSSHLGDELLEIHDMERINYKRDALVLGLGWRPCSDWRLYGEVGYAFAIDGGARPWEFQFGGEYSPARPTTFRGAPFLAVNARLREEVDFGGTVAIQAGWQWRGVTGRLLRLGFHYLNGKSDQFQFHDESEKQYALGLWYDY